MLGCVHFADAQMGLDGHSDADVVAHAVCDALLGAAGLGDIGEHFPPTKAEWKDYPGGGFLEAVRTKVAEAGYYVVNVDCVVMCDVVTLGARKREMANAMAMYLGVDSHRVNVKATTYEGHGAVGRREIIACQAVAILDRR